MQVSVGHADDMSPKIKRFPKRSPCGPAGRPPGRGRRPTAAAEHALIAVGLLHHFPRAHFRLGVALTRLRMYERAIEAFETCLKIAPQSVACHRWLARIYGKRLDRVDLAAEHMSRIDFIRHSMESS